MNYFQLIVSLYIIFSNKHFGRSLERTRKELNLLIALKSNFFLKKPFITLSVYTLYIFQAWLNFFVFLPTELYIIQYHCLIVHQKSEKIVISCLRTDELFYNEKNALSKITFFGVNC